MQRKALYEAVNATLPEVTRPFVLREGGRKIAEAKGPKRVKTAVTPKIAALLHPLWLSETEMPLFPTLISHALDDLVNFNLV